MIAWVLEADSCFWPTALSSDCQRLGRAYSSTKLFSPRWWALLGAHPAFEGRGKWSSYKTLSLLTHLLPLRKVEFSSFLMALCGVLGLSLPWALDALLRAVFFRPVALVFQTISLVLWSSDQPQPGYSLLRRSTVFTVWPRTEQRHSGCDPVPDELMFIKVQPVRLTLPLRYSVWRHVDLRY